MAAQNKLPEMSIYGHLEELRKVLIISIAAFLAATVFIYAFQVDNLTRLITAPLDKIGLQPVIIGVTEGFIVRIKISAYGGLVAALPIILWQVLRFIFPALYAQEKRLALFFVFSSILLFGLGVFFSYHYILDIALKLMLIDFAGGLSPMVSYSKYISFVMLMLWPFGLVFEIPIISLVLTRVGVITPRMMKKNRKFVILAVFILAAFLTPPDVLSQIFLAIPMLLLYEISILVSRFAVKKGKSLQA